MTESTTVVPARKREKRVYSGAKKLGAVFLAIQKGTVAAAKELNIPTSTIDHWLRVERTGLIKIRSFLAERAEASYLEAVNALGREAKRRLETGDVPQEELWKSFRKLIDAQHRPSPSGQTQAAAVARTDIHIHVDDE